MYFFSDLKCFSQTYNRSISISVFSSGVINLDLITSNNQLSRHLNLIWRYFEDTSSFHLEYRKFLVLFPFASKFSVHSRSTTKHINHYLKSTSNSLKTYSFFCYELSPFAAFYLWNYLMMMNYFCGMFDQRKKSSLISSQDHFQISSSSLISHTLRAGFEPVQSPSFAEWSCIVRVTTTSWWQCNVQT